MAASDSVAAYIDAHSEDIIRFCRALVQCPTENPPGTTTAAIDLITGQLSAWRIDSKVVGPRDDAQNIISSVEGTGPGPHLVAVSMGRRNTLS